MKFGPKGTKLDSHTDTRTVKLTSDTNTLSGIYSTYKPPQSSVPVAFNNPHKLNSNSAIPIGSYGHSINLHQQPNTSILVVVVSSSNDISVRSDLVHTSSGQNLPTMAQSCGSLDLSNLSLELKKLASFHWRLCK